ncbi:hypothetical protein PENTCL1PPCAC_892 [Pristionchus entomophagus]|uniref:F-box domain-containing protein n=1 Tax=Pristionchus entomophagus TaxID=358040 RepID=A0AAV5S738_9BILA|nr:hypothetical protein PENTCL1PPCAC_892 [Pristionchus entomophagus]
MNTISEHSRSKAIKLEAESLTISQNIYRPYTTKNGSVHYECYYAKRFCEDCGIFLTSFFFKIRFAKRGGLYYIRAEKTGEKSPKMARQEEFHLPFHCLAYFTAKEAIERADLILRRFNFEECLLQEIKIEDNFLEYFEHAISTWSFAKIKIESCSLILNLSYSTQKRFASLLLSAKPIDIELQSCGYVGDIDASFLSKFAQTAPFVEFSDFTMHEAFYEEYGDGTEWDPNDTVTSDNELPSFLPRFKYLHMHRLLVNTDSLIRALLDRVKIARDGTWEFRITRTFKEAEIAAVMGPNYASYQNEEGPAWYNTTEGVRIRAIETGRIEDEDQDGNNDDNDGDEDQNDEDEEDEEYEDQLWSCRVEFVGDDI